MALIKCKECSREISKKAKTCPNCGHKKEPHITGLFKVCMVVLFGFLWWAMFADPNASGSFTGSSTPVLEVKSWSCNTEHGHTSISGEVKNISDKPLKNVTAVATFKTKDGTFVKSANALIDYNPILAGQTSPFKALSSHNPAIGNCYVSFKTLGGGTLRHTERTK